MARTDFEELVLSSALAIVSSMTSFVKNPGYRLIARYCWTWWRDVSVVVRWCSMRDGELFVAAQDILVACCYTCRFVMLYAVDEIGACYSVSE